MRKLNVFLAGFVVPNFSPVSYGILENILEEMHLISHDFDFFCVIFLGHQTCLELQGSVQCPQ